MRHVVILEHRRMPLAARPYFLREIAEVWRGDGVRVTVVRDPAQRVEADAAILHVDLTVVPPEHLAFVARYPAALNARVADISKRRISRLLVARGDGWDGPVIVKTDANCGGVAEDLVRRRGSAAARAGRALRGALPWTMRARLPTSQYRTFASARDVPAAVWRNRDLVVERFVPEMEDGLYCLRTWVFLGDRETHSLSWSREPVVKSENVVRREALGEVPAALRRIREDLAFDFGKFDYVLQGEEVVLYDANRTPTVGRFSREDFLPRIRHLALGLGAFR